MKYLPNDQPLAAPVTQLNPPPEDAPGELPLRETFEAGYKRNRRAKPLGTAITLERDVRVKLRDGTVLFVDVIRPRDATKAIPAILCWGPYGKSDSYFKLDDFPFRSGVSPASVSDFQTWEGTDPAYWCAQGYAIINADIRGARHSEGTLHFWDSQQARDGHDLVNWIGSQDWCNGRVGMAGNSWLAIAQWLVAAERPKHLAAIAPWEGFCDFYRHCIGRGGMPDPGFTADVISKLHGLNGISNPAEKIRHDTLFTEGWQSCSVEVEAITVPAYVVASWTNFLHSEGTLEAFSRLKGDKKWLRVHNAFEWPDFYAERSVRDLTRFFDRFLKEEMNDWESTPRCRLTMLDPGGTPVVERPEAAYPPERFKETVLHLRSNGSLASSPDADDRTICYDADAQESLSFVHLFEEDAETCGPMHLSFEFAVEGADDADLFATIGWLKAGDRRPLVRRMQLGRLGNAVTWLGTKLGKQDAKIAYWEGPNGRLRASRRHLDSLRSTSLCPVHSFDREELLASRQFARVDIPITPSGLRWRRGDKMELTIAGHALTRMPFSGLEQPRLVSKGTHRIRLGQEHPATLTFLSAPL